MGKKKNKKGGAGGGGGGGGSEGNGGGGGGGGDNGVNSGVNNGGGGGDNGGGNGVNGGGGEGGGGNNDGVGGGVNGGGGGSGGGGGGEEKKENESNEKHLNIVMKINLHCDGCTKRIRREIAKFPGVMKVEFEGESKVKIMAEKNVDAVKLRDKLQKKTLKKTELISPQPPKKDDKKNENNDKPKEAQVTTVMLKVAYHCHGCGERLYRAVASYKGVHEVVIDKEKNTVKVTGRMDVKKMVEDLKKKLNKPVEVTNDKKDKPKENEGNKENENGKKDENGGGGGGGNGKDNNGKKVEYLVNGSGYIGICDGTGRVLEIFDTPQLFSDDNPNACSVM